MATAQQEHSFANTISVHNWKRYSVFLVDTARLQGPGHIAWQTGHWLDFSPYSPVPAENHLCHCMQWPEGWCPSPQKHPHSKGGVKVRGGGTRVCTRRSTAL